MKKLSTVKLFLVTVLLCGATTLAQAPPANPLDVPAAAMARQMISITMPDYPAEAKAAGIHGVVVLRATIGPTGSVDSLETMTGDQRLGDAAKDAVRTWTYKPYLLNGEPVAVATTITLDFNLDKPGAAGSQFGKVSILNSVRVSAGVIAGSLERRVNLVYPEEARSAGVSGTVVLHAFLSKAGEIEDVSVIAGPELLRDSALQAVRQWKYRPYLLNGQAVEVETQITVNFSLAPLQ